LNYSPCRPTFPHLFLENGLDFAPFFLARSIELAEISNLTGTRALEKRRNPVQNDEYLNIRHFYSKTQLKS
jgi:hypothetical protein